MSKRFRKKSAHVPAGQQAGLSAPDRLRPLWLASLAALVVATPLLPSETARQGTGVLLIAAWLVLLLAWLIRGALGGRLELRTGPTLLAVLAFVALHSLSALAMARFGEARSSLNLLWQYLSLAVCFFLA